MELTADGETFAGLMFVFSTPLKFSQKYFYIALAIGAYYLVLLMKGTYIPGKILVVLLKTMKSTFV